MNVSFNDANYPPIARVRDEAHHRCIVGGDATARFTDC
jgi:hypothetical protein